MTRQRGSKSGYSDNVQGKTGTLRQKLKLKTRMLEHGDWGNKNKY